MGARRAIGIALAVGTLAAVMCIARGQWGPGSGGRRIVASNKVDVGGATIQVDVSDGRIELGIEAVTGRVKDAATAVAVYYGRFPVAKARVLIIPEEGKDGVFHGTTWGGRGGFPGFTRISVGEKTTAKELADDWMLTHELTHMGFPDMAEEHHWIEEGLATYVEPIARVQAGQLSAKAIWIEMMDGMRKGEPAEGDRGLDNTHTWGRTYWGGALFCLVADVEIRKQTKNRKGLQDALRAVVAAGGSIDQEWPIEKAFAIGDQATGTHVLRGMYARWRSAPVDVDLTALWKQLGVRQGNAGIELDATAPLAAVREGIVAAR